MQAVHVEVAAALWMGKRVLRESICALLGFGEFTGRRSAI